MFLLPEKNAAMTDDRSSGVGECGGTRWGTEDRDEVEGTRLTILDAVGATMAFVDMRLCSWRIADVG